MAELFGHTAKAHGAKAFVRTQRGAKARLVLKVHCAEALKGTTVDFMLLPDLHDATMKTASAFCARVPSLVTRPSGRFSSALVMVDGGRERRRQTASGKRECRLFSAA